MSLEKAHHVHDIVVQDNATAHFGNQHFAGGLTINARNEPLTDYDGTYAYNALSPVSTYVDRPGLRGQIEAQLHDYIASPSPFTRILFVHGIGGVGKTQLVLNYIRTYRRDYAGVFWIEANGPQSIERDYRQIYALLYGVPQDGGHDKIRFQYVVQAVKRWFYGRQKKWLFVFDNADSVRDRNDPSYIDLRHFLPDDPCIHVLVTTRDRSALDMSELAGIEIQDMEPNEAIQLFRKQAKLYNPTPEQRVQIASIVQTLGYLALAISLAASYIATTPRLQNDVSQYLPEYNERRKSLLAQRPTRLIHQYGASVLTTWETTYRALETENSGACDFFAILCFFSQNDIPVTFPIDTSRDSDHATSSWDAMLNSEQQISSYDLEVYFRTLASYSFVKCQSNRTSYSMHSLVQAWAHDRLDQDRLQHYGLVAASLLMDMVDVARGANPASRNRLLTHIVTACHKISKVFSPDQAQKASLYSLSVLAHFLRDEGRDEDALAAFDLIARKYRLWMGEDNVYTLAAMYDFAVTLSCLSHYEQALSVHRLVLAKRMIILGNDHRDTLVSTTRVAKTLDSLRRYEESEPILRSSLESHKRTLGMDDISTLETMQCLARTLGGLGQSEEALSLLRLVSTKFQQICGDDSYQTRDAFYYLSEQLMHIGRWQEALPLQEAVVEREERLSGRNHVDALLTRSVLGFILRKAGKLQEALSLQREVLDREQQCLGPKHRATLWSSHEMAKIYEALGELEQARQEMRRTFYDRIEVLGPDHPHTIDSKEELEIIENKILRRQRKKERELIMATGVLQISRQSEG